MKKLLTTCILLSIFFTAFSQVYKGSLPSPRPGTPVELREVAPNDYLYHIYDNDSLYLWDINLNPLPSIALNPPAGESSRVSYISKNLFDSDPGIEFMLQFDSAGSRSNLYIYDGGTLTALSNFSGLLFGAKITNMVSGSELTLFSNPTQPTTYIYTLSGQITSASINQIKLQRLNLYPNPARDIIRVPGILNEQLEIYDLSGQKVLQKRMEDSEEIIDVSDFPNGVYIVRSDNGASYKFVKQ